MRPKDLEKKESQKLLDKIKTLKATLESFNVAIPNTIRNLNELVRKLTEKIEGKE